jgi:GTPase SAR1 family protein
MICFSVSNSKSFDTIKTKWIPEVRHHCPGVPILIIATKTDLRDDAELAQRLLDTGATFVTTSMGEQIAKEVGAVCYMETSAKHLNTKHVFDEALRVVIGGVDKKRSNTKKCKIM